MQFEVRSARPTERREFHVICARFREVGDTEVLMLAVLERVGEGVLGRGG